MKNRSYTYYVYILLMRSGKYKVGVTSNIDNRLTEHFRSSYYPRCKDGKPDRVVDVLGIQTFNTKVEALNMEEWIHKELGMKYYRRAPRDFTPTYGYSKKYI